MVLITLNMYHKMLPVLALRQPWSTLCTLPSTALPMLQILQLSQHDKAITIYYHPNSFSSTQSIRSNLANCWRFTVALDTPEVRILKPFPPPFPRPSGYPYCMHVSVMFEALVMRERRHHSISRLLLVALKHEAPSVIPNQKACLS